MDRRSPLTVAGAAPGSASKRPHRIPVSPSFEGTNVDFYARNIPDAPQSHCGAACVKADSRGRSDTASRSGPSRPSEGYDDLPEGLAALQPLKSFGEVGERKHGVDHGREAVRHLLQRLADIPHRAAEGAEDPVLLLEELHKVHGGGNAGGRAAGDEPAAAL